MNDERILIYFRKKNNEFYTDFTKEEINNQINKEGKDAFIYFCKELDIPFIEYEYNNLKKRYSENFFGKYLSKMKLTSYRPYTFVDTERFNEK